LDRPQRASYYAATPTAVPQCGIFAVRRQARGAREAWRIRPSDAAASVATNPVSPETAQIPGDPFPFSRDTGLTSASATKESLGLTSLCAIAFA
jgi:hypothetical protein